jgi:hypothetical protein
LLSVSTAAGRMVVMSSEEALPSEYTRGGEADDAGKYGYVLPCVATVPVPQTFTTFQPFNIVHRRCP